MVVLISNGCYIVNDGKREASLIWITLLIAIRKMTFDSVPDLSVHDETVYKLPRL